MATKTKAPTRARKNEVNSARKSAIKENLLDTVVNTTAVCSEVSGLVADTAIWLRKEIKEF